MTSTPLPEPPDGIRDPQPYDFRLSGARQQQRAEPTGCKHHESLLTSQVGERTALLYGAEPLAWCGSGHTHMLLKKEACVEVRWMEREVLDYSYIGVGQQRLSADRGRQGALKL